MKNILFVTFLFLSISSVAQNRYLKIPETIFDKTTINHIVDSIKNRKVLNEYLVYQRAKTNGLIFSYLICKIGEIEYLWVISRDKIIGNRKLNDNSIFLYKNILKTGATKLEDSLKFKPPMLSVVNNEVVIYYNIKMKIKFYFEYGDNITTYSPLPEKNEYRKKWIEIIRKQLFEN